MDRRFIHSNTNRSFSKLFLFFHLWRRWRRRRWGIDVLLKLLRRS
jgi:hypothetical protein